MFGGKRITTRADRFFSAMIGAYQDGDAAQMVLPPEALEQLEPARKNTFSFDICAPFTLDNDAAHVFTHRLRDGYDVCIGSIAIIGDYPDTLPPSIQAELADYTQPPFFSDADPTSATNGGAPVVALVGSDGEYLSEPLDFMRMIPAGSTLKVFAKRHPLDSSPRLLHVVFNAWEIAKSW